MWLWYLSLALLIITINLCFFIILIPIFKKKGREGREAREAILTEARESECVLQLEEQHDVKIIVAGFPRSGTASLSRAFTYLNYGKVFHIETNTFVENRKYLNWWVGKEKMRENGEEINYCEFFDLFKIDIAMDWPLSLFWYELLETYPNAKVILCVRDFDKWYVSINYLLFDMLRSKAFYFATFIAKPFYEIYHVWFEKYVNLYGGLHVFKDKEKLKLKHFQRIENIKNIMKNKGKSKDLLIYNCINDGWKPLCAFLNIKPIPKVPFPRSNSSNNFFKDVIISNIKLKLLDNLGLIRAD